MADARHLRVDQDQELTPLQKAQAKENVDLGNVDNTSDAQKAQSGPIQQAIQKYSIIFGA